MSFQERRSLLSLISSIVITVAYTLYMAPRYPEADAYSMEVFRFWGGFFVFLIPVSIVARIILNIVLGMFNTDEDVSLMDERDRLIELKAARYSLYIFASGFILAMAALWFDQPPHIMFMLLFVGGFGAEIVSETTQFFLYRRGF